MTNEDKKNIEFFKNLENELSASIEKFANGETESINGKKEIEEKRRTKHKELSENNAMDEMVDYVHDAVLCWEDEDAGMMPKGYEAIIIDSSYNALFRSYDTLAKVYAPQNKSYYLRVHTYNKVPIGTQLL